MRGEEKMEEIILTKEQRDRERLVEDLPGYEPVELFDKYGNPTPETLEAFYEADHGLTEPITLEELRAEIHALCSVE